MQTFRQEKLLVIVGPTSSGKSALALALAQKFRGEIINADSKAIYRYMDIGTAKATKTDMLLIPHHLLDIINPGQPYSAAEFKRDAGAAIADIAARGALPIMVGGTGLYVDSVLYDYQFPQKPIGQPLSHQRSLLNHLSLSQLVEKLEKVDPAAAALIDLHNPRRIIRAIEMAGSSKSKAQSMRSDTMVIGLVVNKKVMQKRSQQRLETMLTQGLIDEISSIGQRFGWANEAMTGLAYRIFKDVILGTKSMEFAKAEYVYQELHLAKRQMTWFKRNRSIHWLDSEDPRHPGEAERLVDTFLS